MLSFKSFLILLKESFRDLLPIILVIVFFQLIVIQSIPSNWLSTSIGLIIVGVGLAVFLLGLEVGIFPVGEGLASDFAKRGSTGWIVLFAFMVGFGTRYAGGCTSGHAITGLSNLQWPSLVAVIGFFIGGLFITHIIYPIIY